MEMKERKGVTLTCLKKDCPRKKKIDFDAGTMPKGTVEIKSYCPWHQDLDGDKVSAEFCYNKNGKELLWGR